ncbi:SprT family zinc-dependent metalloprotease [Aestuariibacter sp. A3R04]|uniref:SprT family zinc-dependent metalloprotease n=1 Tax=Aestuariibacter sp. A3R04 TaxID=2841571 RepID=UPI001C0904FC|nr:SprT family zinc-dependent metalloprotease [Aestuariibacter sp. A3R04]MBU3023068.1 SprT family zinc-dependent metalloprotease [Aestuariibacter sp. A3R04]
MITQEDKQAVKDEVYRLYHIAETKLQRPFPLPAVTFRKSGRNAGTAFLQQNRVNFNPVLFTHNADAFITNVIPHEVCHLLTYQLHGRVRPHGVEWQSLMRGLFNAQPSTTHNFDLTTLQLNTVIYRCNCGDIPLSIRRHNKVLKGMQYRCKRCQQILTR